MTTTVFITDATPHGCPGVAVFGYVGHKPMDTGAIQDAVEVDLEFTGTRVTIETAFGFVKGVSSVRHSASLVSRPSFGQLLANLPFAIRENSGGLAYLVVRMYLSDIEYPEDESDEEVVDLFPSLTLSSGPRSAPKEVGDAYSSVLDRLVEEQTAMFKRPEQLTWFSSWARSFCSH